MNAPQHRVLVVDDNTDVREALELMLQLHQVDVDSACDGREAIGCLAAKPPPCMILLDLMMPVMDGFEFRLWQLGDARAARIRTVAISGYDAGLLQMTELGVAECLPKPVDVERVLRLLETCSGH